MKKTCKFQNQNIETIEKSSTRHIRRHTCSRNHIHSFHRSKTYYQRSEKQKTFSEAEKFTKLEKDEDHNQWNWTEYEESTRDQNL